VIATVSSQEKAALARAVGAHHVVNYREAGAGDIVRSLAPEGIQVIVEVAPHENAEMDLAVLAPGGAVAIYSGSSAAPVEIPIGAIAANVRLQFVSIFTMPQEAKRAALQAVTDALVEGVLPVGAEAGLPLHRFPLARTEDAHYVLERGVVGKVLVDVAPELS
jgi:NADPH2:quinone reductase